MRDASRGIGGAIASSHLLIPERVTHGPHCQDLGYAAPSVRSTMATPRTERVWAAGGEYGIISSDYIIEIILICPPCRALISWAPRYRSTLIRSDLGFAGTVAAAEQMADRALRKINGPIGKVGSMEAPTIEKD